MKRLKIILLICIFLFPSVLTACGGNGDKLQDSGLDYTESVAALNNPWRGFYFPVAVKLKASNNGPVNMGQINNYKSSYSLMHLRVGLEAFSTAAGGKDGDISGDALRILGDYLTAARANGVSVILRLSYNIDGLTAGGSYRENEPALSVMLGHIAQTGGLLESYTDVVVAVESGMLGPWGEQHSTAAMTENNLSQIVQRWLDTTVNITVSVRRPLFFVWWYNSRYSTSYTIDIINQIPVSVPATDEYRVGVYNDGYLGSASDLGTYADRNKEVEWLKNQASHTFFGGEVAGNNGGGAINAYNAASFLESEAFKTHTAYLNIEWNDAVIAAWGQKTYSGGDKIYKGKTTELRYIENHLGYRFVLRSSRLPENAGRNKQLRLKGEIENVGFASLLTVPSYKIILADADGNSVFETAVSFDLNNMSYDLLVNIPDIPAGEYTVYLYAGGIAFANNGGIYNTLLRANKLGGLKIN